jgi:hypothetical protein
MILTPNPLSMQWRGGLRGQKGLIGGHELIVGKESILEKAGSRGQGGPDASDWLRSGGRW